MFESLYEKQIMLEKLYNKNQLYKRVKEVFMTQEDYFLNLMDKCEIEYDFGWKLIIWLSIYIRMDVETAVGMLCDNEDYLPQRVADLLLQAASGDLIDYSTKDGKFTTKFRVPADVQEELDKFQFPLPMQVEPKKVTKNSDTGYFTSSGSIILKDNHHERDVNLDHINRMNSIRLKLNQDVILMVKNKWRNLDKQKKDESFIDFQKRRKAFEKYDRTSKDVFSKMEESFFLTHKYDKRLRVYCQGYHINYMGNDYNKATVLFADEEIIT